MSYKNTNLKKMHHALKTYLDGMKKAKAAQEKRAADNAEFTNAIRQKYNPEAYKKEYFDTYFLPKMHAEIEAHNKATKEAFLKEMQQTAQEMYEAAETLKEGKDFRLQALDFEDGTLVNALKMIEIYGKDMPAEEQANLCYTFRGDMPALQAIESKMKQNGLHYHSIAHRLQGKLDPDLCDEMAQQAYRLTLGEYNLKGYESWITEQLNEKAEMYGLDLSVDPYRQALKKDAYTTGGNSEWYQEEQRQQEAHKLIKKWESELQEMEAAGNTEQANRSAKQIYDVLKEDGIKIRE